VIFTGCVQGERLAGDGDTGADSASEDSAVDSGSEESAEDTNSDDPKDQKDGSSDMSAVDTAGLQCDAGSPAPYYEDQDSDGFGKDSVTKTACEQPDGYTVQGGDCDDQDPASHPNVSELCDGKDNDCDGQTDEQVQDRTFYRDSDGDGYGTSSDTKTDCKQPNGYVVRDGDCDDSAPNVNPGANEQCNGRDDDCNGQTDETGGSTYYYDGDGDGFGTVSRTKKSCSKSSNFVSQSGDCDDSAGDTHPNAASNESSSGCFKDADGDGYGDDSTGGGIDPGTDCDDSDSSVHPGASETCNNQDDDCNGRVDEGASQNTCYSDGDGDGYGDQKAGDYCRSCVNVSGVAGKDGDCDDSDSSVYPGANEKCNGTDDDCDGQTDEGVENTCYVDGDGDGYGGSKAGDYCRSCLQVGGAVSSSGDCDDSKSKVYPGASEKCNSSTDYDCDGNPRCGDGECDGEPCGPRWCQYCTGGTCRCP